MKNLAFAWHVVGRWTGWLPGNLQHEPTENPWGWIAHHGIDEAIDEAIELSSIGQDSA